MRILLSAYGCGPGEGSEPGAGWSFARAAATRHQVTVLTRRRFREAIEAERAADPDLRANLTVHYLDLGDLALRLKKRGIDVYWYYAGWQRKAAAVARDLHATDPFDVLHHITFAADWLPCGIGSVPDVPLVWGPVGGATRPPWRLARWLGVRGLAGELVRTPITAAARRAWGDPAAERAALVVALNADVATRFRRAGRLVVEPNAAIDPAIGVDHAAAPGTGRTAVYIGRLVAWKGPHLALAALARPEAAGWTLDLYGAGPELGRLQRRAAALGLDDRVRFHGMRPRTEVLAALGSAGAMLFPSMHDSAPWAVAEAATLGCPVICLDRGGPPLLAAGSGTSVPVTGDVPGALAQALRDTSARAEPTDRWSADRLPGLLDDWYRQVTT